MFLPALESASSGGSPNRAPARTIMRRVVTLVVRPQYSRQPPRHDRAVELVAQAGACVASGRQGDYDLHRRGGEIEGLGSQHGVELAHDARLLEQRVQPSADLFAVLV